jgi:hypothetical protein
VVSGAEILDNLATFVRENRELIMCLLAHGGAEARGYALGVLTNRAGAEDIDTVERELN